MTATNTHSVVTHDSLKKGDIVTFVSLLDGSVHENVEVTYVSVFRNEGFNYKENGGTKAVNNTTKVVIIRKDTPRYWPPLPGDVWKTGSHLFVRLAPSTYHKDAGYFIDSTGTSWTTEKENEIRAKYPDLQLVYRNGTTIK